MTNFCQAPGCLYAKDCQIVLDYQDDYHHRGNYCAKHALEQLDFYKSIIGESSDHAELMEARQTKEIENE